MTTNNSNKDKFTPKRFNFLSISFSLIIAYLTLKLIILPITQTVINIIPHLNSPENIKINSVKIPELSFQDLILLSVIFLFQPQSAKIFESFDLSSQGIKAKFRQLKEEVDEAKEEIDKRQQEQLDKIEDIQQFMYQLLLTKNEIDQLIGLKEHRNNQTSFDFRVYEPAAKELRRLRDSKLIRVKPPYRYIQDLEKVSHHGEVKIDLTQYCELTPLGERFLHQLEQISDPIEPPTEPRNNGEITG